jgi:VCPO second helical-bundle domain
MSPIRARTNEEETTMHVHRRGARVALVLLVVMLTLVGATTAGAKKQSSGEPDTYVASWDAVGAQAFTAAGLTAAEGHVIFAYVGIAVYDAVMAIEGGHEPFAVDVDAPEGASAEAAVAAAAHKVLSHYLPAQQAGILDPALVTSLAGISDGPAKTAGIATGEGVASLLISQRSDDGFRATQPPYVPPNPPVAGVWIPTAATPPVGPYLGLMRPFALRSADQFRPGGPPPLDSKRWVDDYNEVQELGSSTSTTRTAEQTVAARFWAEAPVQQARRSFRELVLDRELDVADASRLLAMLSVTYADGLIACFDAKYHFLLWRPITAVRAGDTDGNDDTVGDPTWSPLLPTPNHPEYPSAHSCLTPSAGHVIAAFLQTKQIDLTIPSLTGLGDRHYATPDDLEYEVSNARIWGGIHYRTAVEDGVEIAKRTTNHVLAHYFHKAND